MTHQFKPGDVVFSYNEHDARQLEPMLELIVDDRLVSESLVPVIAWRVCSPAGHRYITPDWHMGPGAMEAYRLKPHPEPDRVFAEFAAWRLTQ